MSEYSRIVIEEYCNNHPKTKKARFLLDLIDKSYDLSYILNDYEAICLERLIDNEKDPELKEALQDLDDFLTCF